MANGKQHIRLSDVLTFLLFVLLASGLWYGHAMNSVRNARVPVLMHYTGIPATIGFDGKGLPDTVMIEVRDAGARLAMYIREPLNLTIDMRGYLHGEKGTLQVPSDALRRSISDILLGTSSLIGTTPDEISCTYFTEQEKTVPIKLDAHLQPAKEYQMVGQPKLSRSMVKIYGSGKVLSTIDSVRTEHVHLNGLTDTTVVRVALQSGQGLRLGTDSIDVQIMTERFTEKKATIPLQVNGVPDGYTIRLFPREVEVTIRVGINHFARVSANDIKAVCTYTPERTDKLDVELKYSNPYITNAWVYPSTVEFILEQ